ncbi:ankyrin repeat domain-containing protein [Rhodovarius sp.]|uniref:ankyrin repeat domain-containing protein n=1 Tax=Rhodovarius sp. TaxID=2972673 RepID=UPI00334182F1
MKHGDEAGAASAIDVLLGHPLPLEHVRVGGRTLLAEAVRWDCREIVAALLDHGADPNASDASGMAPLHWAAMTGKLGLMHQLLEWAACPQTKDSAGITPLQKATLTAPPASLGGAREMLLLAGAGSQGASGSELAQRLAADAYDSAYLSRIRAEGAVPPANGVAANVP